MGTRPVFMPSQSAIRDISLAPEGERKIDFFYAALEPFGDWVQVDPYGYCWQPREAQTAVYSSTT